MRLHSVSFAGALNQNVDDAPPREPPYLKQLDQRDSVSVWLVDGVSMTSQLTSFPFHKEQL
jgi:hypothetical protein